jgi:hypothetical protein
VCSDFALSLSSIVGETYIYIYILTQYYISIFIMNITPYEFGTKKEKIEFLGKLCLNEIIREINEKCKHSD